MTDNNDPVRLAARAWLTAAEEFDACRDLEQIEALCLKERIARERMVEAIREERAI